MQNLWKKNNRSNIVISDIVTRENGYKHCVKSVQIRSYFWSVFSCIRIEYWDLRNDTNLLMSMSLLLIFLKKVLYCNWLATKNHFWSRQELKMWISGALFEEKRFSFDNLDTSYFVQKVNSFIKILKSQFQNPQNLKEKIFFFTVQTKVTSNSRQNRN